MFEEWLVWHWAHSQSCALYPGIPLSCCRIEMPIPATSSATRPRIFLTSRHRLVRNRSLNSVALEEWETARTLWDSARHAYSERRVWRTLTFGVHSNTDLRRRDCTALHSALQWSRANRCLSTGVIEFITFAFTRNTCHRNALRIDFVTPDCILGKLDHAAIHHHSIWNAAALFSVENFHSGQFDPGWHK